MQAAISVFCNSETDSSYFNGSEFQFNQALSRDSASLQVNVDALTRSAACSAIEELNQPGIERDHDCGPRVIPAGGISSCTVTNTALFEGIPTLNGIGVSMLALLMLGMGVVGLQRID